MARNLVLTFLAICFWICAVIADNGTSTSTESTESDDIYDANPILQYRPSFARSLPVQLLLAGIVFTLATVLLIHLAFTVQYHWRLAPINYVLQLSGVTTLFICHIAMLHVILTQTLAESLEWPYMLSYIAVDIPPLEDSTGWTSGELAGWLLMNATTSGLIQITHIHFLSLLYPSRAEKLIVLCLLGPLALLNAISQLLPIWPNPHLVSAADTISNICNATLSILFTSSLFIWGFLLNRRSAWRTDGATAAFGFSATLLAVISMFLNVAYIPTQDQYEWGPGLIWVVMLWQSFLGFWWWVGSGMGGGEVEEMVEREERRRVKRRERKRRRMEQRERAREVFKGVTGALRYRRHSNSNSNEHSNSESDVAVQSPTAQDPTPPPSTHTHTHTPAAPAPNSLIQRWFHFLRNAHLRAARQQAAETTQLRNQIWGGEDGVRRERPRRRLVMGMNVWGYDGRARNNDNNNVKDSDSEDAAEGEGEDIEMADRPQGRRVLEGEEGGERGGEEGGEEGGKRPTSMFWWGPLQRWRLQDSTVY